MNRRIGTTLLMAGLLAASSLAAAPSFFKEPGPKVEFVLAGDSLVMSWNSVQTVDQPIARYEYEIKKTGDTTLVAGQTTGLSTVEVITMPPVGDSLIIWGRVRAVNTRGKMSAYGRSPNFVIKTQDPGPATPQPTIRDTTTAAFNITDVMIAFRAVGGAHAIPGTEYSLAEGDSVEVCLLATDGLRVQRAPDPVEWSTEDATVVDLSVMTGPSGTHCKWAYAMKNINNLPAETGFVRIAPTSSKRAL